MKIKQSETYNNLPANHRMIPARLAATLALFTLLALPAGAQTVLNPSFESPSPTDGNFIGPAALDWSDETSFHPDPIPPTGRGVYNPREVDFTGAGGSGTATGGTGANGINVFTAYTDNAPDAYAGVSQVIADAQLTAGVTYTLTVAVGDYKTTIPSNWHLAVGTVSMGFGSFLADRAGLASELINDQFKDFSIQYTATGAEGQNGENLKITLWAKNDGSGTHVPFDNVRFTTALASSTSDFKATITPTAGILGNYDFSWNSQTGKVYDLVSSTDLATPPTSWGVWQNQTGIVANPPTNSLITIPGGGDRRRFFVVIERNAL